MRVCIVVEGQTEEAVVKGVLAPHLDPMGVYLCAIIVKTSPGHRGGGRRWIKWKNDIDKILSQHRGPMVRVTTLFDLFRLPKGFPGMEAHGGDTDTNRRCDALQEEMGQVFDDWRFIPYLQRHEVEALVLASMESLHDLFDALDDLEGLKQLGKEMENKAPEDVNDGPETAPSKRLTQHIRSYRKTIHGPTAIELTGLKGVRERCPRFDKWIATLEALAEERAP